MCPMCGNNLSSETYNSYRDELNQKYGVCTHPFVHINHVKYLGYLIHPSIKNWFCDNWITMIYRLLNRVIVTEQYVIENKIYDSRYVPVSTRLFTGSY